MTSKTTDIDNTIKTVNIKITSTDSGKLPGKQPGTGIKENSLFNIIVLLLSCLYVLIAVKRRRNSRTI